MFRRTEDLRVLDEEWQRFDDEAKEDTFSLDDWSDLQIQRWDLDQDNREPTGKNNPRTYRADKPLRRQNHDPSSDRQYDVRNDPRIGGADADDEEDDW